jgi:hypothetical protein
MYDIGLFLFTGAGWACGIPSVFTRYCNNLYLNSVLFEVRNVFTSLLGLVIVSHLSPKGSGRFNGQHYGAASYSCATTWTS